MRATTPSLLFHLRAQSVSATLLSCNSTAAHSQPIASIQIPVLLLSSPPTRFPQPRARSSRRSLLPSNASLAWRSGIPPSAPHAPCTRGLRTLITIPGCLDRLSPVPRAAVLL
ncbi:uncharacterized protein K452DRAFT_79717 [Aplosporella prunicola CBS 121167]|uniref:REJ domain-containing protein n=1 Tax=Aplosporella prunicola CBS 121167 TaxID=1176127 RepID=A0A6A6B718_9PEZI|nr:uncharacterized protein K452DRAFT_79717 [Aplosporella prunicola CBS 121167]KAF2139025.1 hypothetical protein K452DRAFT_79717 [Aplosporella prunicola CBS 121167]